MKVEGFLEKIIPNDKMFNNFYGLVLKGKPNECWVTKMPLPLRSGDYLVIIPRDQKKIKDDFIIQGMEGGYIKFMKVYKNKNEMLKGREPFIDFIS